eukprot:SM000197S05446  [mRNA]  locus=s197:29162:31850:+ [translate_table: standard]
MRAPRPTLNSRLHLLHQTTRQQHSNRGSEGAACQHATLPDQPEEAHLEGRQGREQGGQLLPPLHPQRLSPLQSSVSGFLGAKESSSKTDTTRPPRIRSKYTNREPSFVVPFETGLDHVYTMPPGMGFGLDCLQEEDLTATTVPRGTAWPFIIRVVTAEHPCADSSCQCELQAQTTYGVFAKQAEGIFSMHVLKQVWWRDGVAYVLNEIFGIDSQPEESTAATMDDSGKECVICLADKRDTLVLPCRHLCMCLDCAKSLRRSVVDSLLQIKFTSCGDAEPGTPIFASPPPAGFTSIPLAKTPCQPTESPACDPLIVTIIADTRLD